MLLAHYYALATGAVLLTIGELFLAPKRTAVTALGAFLAWGLVALVGDATETYADAGANVTTVNNSTVAVAQGERLVAAPVPDEFRYFAAFWSLLSVAILLLYIWGTYPPAQDAQPSDQTDQT